MNKKSLTEFIPLDFEEMIVEDLKNFFEAESRYLHRMSRMMSWNFSDEELEKALDDLKECLDKATEEGMTEQRRNCIPLKEKRKIDGVCPECGHKGDWVNLALVCPEHGRFAG